MAPLGIAHTLRVCAFVATPVVGNGENEKFLREKQSYHFAINSLLKQAYRTRDPSSREATLYSYSGSLSNPGGGMA